MVDLALTRGSEYDEVSPKKVNRRALSFSFSSFFCLKI